MNGIVKKKKTKITTIGNLYNELFNCLLIDITITTTPHSGRIWKKLHIIGRIKRSYKWFIKRLSKAKLF